MFGLLVPNAAWLRSAPSRLAIGFLFLSILGSRERLPRDPAAGTTALCLPPVASTAVARRKRGDPEHGVRHLHLGGTRATVQQARLCGLPRSCLVIGDTVEPPWLAGIPQEHDHG